MPELPFEKEARNIFAKKDFGQSVSAILLLPKDFSETPAVLNEFPNTLIM